MKAALFSIALALGAVLAWQWHAWPPPAPVIAAETPANLAPPPSAGLPPGLPPPTPKDAYASVRNRPLFLPDRRPPPPEEVEEVPPEEPADLAGMKLTAVVIAPQTVSAWVQSPASPELLRLRIGDDLEGWSVTGIEPDTLLLERQGTRNTLKLQDFRAEEAAPPPPAPGAVTRQRAAPPQGRPQPPVPPVRRRARTTPAPGGQAQPGVPPVPITPQTPMRSPVGARAPATQQVPRPGSPGQPR